MSLPSRLSLLLLLVVTAPDPSRAFAASASAFADWPSFHRAVAEWPLDSTRVARVHSLMIERDAGAIVLEEGRIVRAKPLPGGAQALVFSGRGSFRFEPRSEIERQQLRRFYGATTLRRTFSSLAIVFTDSTEADLTGLAYEADTLGALRRAWNAAMPYLLVRRTQLVRPAALAQTLVDGEANGLFWSVLMDRLDHEPVFFEIDPFATERVLLGRRPEDDREGLIRHYNSEIVSQFFAAGDVDTLRTNVLPPYEATHYALQTTLANDLKLTGVADVTLRAARRERAWVAFELPYALKLDDVTREGHAQSFLQENESDIVWVHVDPPLEPGTPATLRLRYRGEAFSRDDDWVEHRDPTGWYPQPLYGGDATWDLAYEYPSDIQLVSAGESVSDSLGAATHHARWRVDQPVPWASFDVNFLKAYHVRSDSLPPLTVWIRHVGAAGKEVTLDDAHVWTPRDDDERVTRDVARAIKFFQNELGAPLAHSFQAVETPADVYVAFPGLIHLMLRKDAVAPGAEHSPELIRAHEIAHQWWGLGVDDATYHDRWLSEGFSDFSSLWYTQAGRHDSKAYLDVLEAWRKDLLVNRHFPLGGEKQAGPIWLGPRTNSSATPDDYSLIIYEKGAWVLHMLRNYLLDDASGDEHRFRGLLRDFYQRWAGRKAFTEDFRAAAEKAAGEDLGWFFEQWVYGTDVPTYKVHWAWTPADGGQWRIHGRIEQAQVPASFRMPVFVRVDFADGSYSRQRVWVRGPVTELDLPLAPKKPAGVVFNDLQSVLCEVERQP